MKVQRIATLALGGLLSSLLTVTAQAESLKTGSACGFVSVTDPQGAYGTQTGEVDGGPVVIVDDTDPTIVHTGHIECAIHIGDANSMNGAADSTSVAGPETSAVVDLPPSQMTYSAGPDDNVYLCTRLVTEEGTWYGDFGTNDPTDPTFEWSTSPATNCSLAISAGPPDPIFLLFLDIIEFVCETVYGPDYGPEARSDCPPYLAAYIVGHVVHP